MHLILCERGSEPFLIQELRRGAANATHQVRAPGLVDSDFGLQLEAPPLLVFGRQLLPFAEACQIPSINAWADVISAAALPLPDNQPWALHLLPCYGFRSAGNNRCRLLREAIQDVLRQKRRHLLRYLETSPKPFTREHSVIQLLLTAPDSGFLSVALAPAPYSLRQSLWPWPAGEYPVVSDKAAPSRAFAKLLEAEQRMGCCIRAGDTCVDLGASPGSWTYVALQRGAEVVAVDRAPLRTDLMAHPNVSFRKGDAFRFEPENPVDWLLCDVIAEPQRSIDLLLQWLREHLPRRFVVTIKFKGQEDYGILERLKYALPALCTEFHLTRLCANKNEVCAFGTAGFRRAQEQS
jgi:23S rRNA (cytidine2498-2'-O)-methyltransferase